MIRAGSIEGPGPRQQIHIDEIDIKPMELKKLHFIENGFSTDGPCDFISHNDTHFNNSHQLAHDPNSSSGGGAGGGDGPPHDVTVVLHQHHPGSHMANGQPHELVVTSLPQSHHHMILSDHHNPVGSTNSNNNNSSSNLITTSQHHLPLELTNHQQLTGHLSGPLTTHVNSDDGQHAVLALNHPHGQPHHVVSDHHQPTVITVTLSPTISSAGEITLVPQHHGQVSQQHHHQQHHPSIVSFSQADTVVVDTLTAIVPHPNITTATDGTALVTLTSIGSAAEYEGQPGPSTTAMMIEEGKSEPGAEQQHRRDQQTGEVLIGGDVGRDGQPQLVVDHRHTSSTPTSYIIGSSPSNSSSAASPIPVVTSERLHSSPHQTSVITSHSTMEQQHLILRGPQQTTATAIQQPAPSNLINNTSTNNNNVSVTTVGQMFSAEKVRYTGPNGSQVYYQCAKCPYKTKRSSDLKRHMKVHDKAAARNSSQASSVPNGLQPHYVCELCGYKTLRAQDLRRHKLKTKSREGLIIGTVTSGGTGSLVSGSAWDTPPQTNNNGDNSNQNRDYFQPDQQQAEVVGELAPVALVANNTNAVVNTIGGPVGMPNQISAPTQTNLITVSNPSSQNMENGFSDSNNQQNNPVFQSQKKLHCCDLCPYKTKRHSDLKRHKNIHNKTANNAESDQVMYGCDLCDYKSKRARDVKRHKLKTKLHLAEMGLNPGERSPVNTNNTNIIKRTTSAPPPLPQVVLQDGQPVAIKSGQPRLVRSNQLSLNTCQSSNPHQDIDWDANTIFFKVEPDENHLEESGVNGSTLTGQQPMSMHQPAAAPQLHSVIENNDFFRCDQCEYSTKRGNDLRRHLKVHNKEQYRCEVCNYSTWSKKAVNIHVLKQHLSNMQEYQMIVQAESANSSTEGDTVGDQSGAHNNNNNNNPSQVKICTFCSRKCSTKINLLRHMESHSTLRIHACPECDYETTLVHDMERHATLKHTAKSARQASDADDSNSFNCDFCNFQFSSKKDLNIHIIKVHVHGNPNKVYKVEEEEENCDEEDMGKICPLCSRSKLFNRKSELMLHILQSHADTKIYTCPICTTYETLSMADLERHKQLKHSQQQQQQQANTSASGENTILLPGSVVNLGYSNAPHQTHTLLTSQPYAS